MVALRLQQFGGMIPALDAHLLPQNQADLTQNAWLYSGALEGLRTQVPIYECENEFTRKVFRIPFQYFDKDHMADAFFMEFPGQDTDVIHSLTNGDSFERYYWATPGVAPKYNTRDRILNSDPAYILGIPAPSIAPSVSASGGTGVPESRAYVYTWVSAYGEEGPPSPPTLFTGNSDDTWLITVTAPGSGDTADRNLSKVRIYRTITSSAGAATYFFVDEMPLATTVYEDTTSSAIVSNNNILESLFWSAPPEDLEGWVTLPNGIVAGWRKNEVWFCEPYRPHAWPTNYTVSVDHGIVGFGVIGQTLIVCTTAFPYAISGITPSTMAISRIAANEPCLSRGSIISTQGGVIYASPNGLAFASAGTIEIATRNLINKDEWLDSIYAQSLRAAPLNGAYYCWGSVRAGCFSPDGFDPEKFLQVDFTGAYRGVLVDVSNQRVAFNTLTTADPIYNVFPDTWTGEVLVLRGGKVYWLDLSEKRDHEPFLWKSKIFEMPNKRNLEAMRVWFQLYSGSPDLNPVANTALVQELAEDQRGLVRVYADGVLKFTRELRNSGDFFRLPSGFKATYWQIEIESRVKVLSVEFATAAKELGSV